MTIAVIGGGASGMACALQAAWKGATVTMFERNPLLGRKLLVTGSGRCNITNDSVSAEKYTCADQVWMETMLGCFGVRDLLGMLREIGIPVYKTSDGWYYPLSESAQTVVDSFSSALNLAGVTLRTATRVTSIQPGAGGFVVGFAGDAGDKSESFSQVVLAAGGKAYPALGSRGELFAVARQMGHAMIPKRPALAPVLADLGELNPLQGLRLDAGVTLWDGNKCLASSSGNLIFTQWGLNGPAVMNVSHHISALPKSKLVLSLDLLSFYHAEFKDLLKRKRKTPTPLAVLLGAFFPPRVAALYVRLVHLPDRILLNQLEDSTLERLVDKLRDTRLVVKGVRGFEYCQVSAGGVPVGEVHPQTMASRLVNGLYLTGETLDVVGPCGGYNLHFAFSSGALAGLAAASK